MTGISDDVGATSTAVYSRSVDEIVRKLLEQKPAPSIPSKFRTLFIRQTEKKAFGITSQRFRNNWSDSPAPGQYQPDLTAKEATLIAQERPSFSSKGYGNGFISSTIRFPRSLKSSLGPGLYDPKNIKDIKPPCFKGTDMCTRVFKQPVSSSPSVSIAIRRRRPEDVGPGSYSVNWSVLDSNVKQCGAASVFRSKTNRTMSAPGTISATSNIAPGSYEIDEDEKKLHRTVNTCFQASFKSRTGREKTLLAPGWDGPSPTQYDTVSAEKVWKGKEDARATAQALAILSARRPVTRHHQRNLTKSHWSATNAPHPNPIAFVSLQSRNQSIIDKQQGQGQGKGQQDIVDHIIPNINGKTNTANPFSFRQKQDYRKKPSFFFKSASKRWEAYEEEHPGPADYQPIRSVGVTSFHLQTPENHWI